MAQQCQCVQSTNLHKEFSFETILTTTRRTLTGRGRTQLTSGPSLYPSALQATPPCFLRHEKHPGIGTWEPTRSERQPPDIHPNYWGHPSGGSLHSLSYQILPIHQDGRSLGAQNTRNRAPLFFCSAYPYLVPRVGFTVTSSNAQPHAVRRRRVT